MRYVTLGLLLVLLASPAQAAITFLDAGSAQQEATPDNGAQWYTQFVGTWSSSNDAVSMGPRTIKGVGAFSILKLNKMALGPAAGRVKFWFRTSALPSASTRIMQVSVGSFNLAVTLSSAGHLQLTTGNGATTQLGSDGTTTIATDTVYRIALALTITNSTTFSAKVFVNESTTDISVTNSGTLAGGGDSYVGSVDSQATSLTLYYSNIYADDDGSVTDPGNVQVTAKLPTTANANNFGTTIGTGAVDERPFSISNGVERPDSSQSTQNYAIQAAGTGDVDLTGATIVGYVGWILAKGTTGGIGTPKITVNGTDTAITLTNGAALFQEATTSATYPSNAATIGMVSTGAGDDTFLYECGIMVAYLPAAPATSVRHRSRTL